MIKNDQNTSFGGGRYIHHIYHIHAMAIWPYSLFLIAYSPLPIQLSFIYSSLFVGIIANLTIALPIFVPAIDLALPIPIRPSPFSDLCPYNFPPFK